MKAVRLRRPGPTPRGLRARPAVRATGVIRAAPVRFLLTLAATTWIAGSPIPSDAADPAKASTPVPRWLVVGPVPAPLPAFHDEKPFAYEPADLLNADRFPRDAEPPVLGRSVEWPGGAASTWRAVDAPKNGELTLSAPAPSSVPAVARLASYVEVPRFAALELVVLGSHPRRAWVDGDAVASGGADTSRADVTAKVTLPRGKHVLAVETVFDPARKASWRVGASWRASSDASPLPNMSLDPERDLDLLDVLDAPDPVRTLLAPDGRRVATVLERVVPGTDRAESWVEIRSTDTGERVTTWRAFSGKDLQWRPDGRALSYFTTEERRSEGGEKGKEKPLGTLWVLELDTGRAAPLVERVDGLESHVWSPDGGAIVFATSEEPQVDSRGLKRVEGLLDRQRGFRTKSHLSLLDVAGRSVRRLTAGPITTGAPAFSNDGKRLLFTRDVEDLSARPFHRTELWEMDLATFTARKLRDSRWLSEASYSPDGSRLLLRAGVSEFGDAGRAVPDGVVPNDFENELFVWDPAAGAVDAITRGFDPSVLEASWCAADGKIYLRALDRDFVRLVGYDPASRAFTRLDVGADVVQSVDVARHAPVATVLASSPWVAPALVAVDLATGSSRVLDRPAEEHLAHVRRGTLEPWSFIASSGLEIDGRVYLPPDFDAQAKYPCIVYYYGGTGPVGREFGGRYPKEWWAAQGYVVYVLQPSGATGYGQRRAAQHVNDWGETTSQEIIEGVQKFLAAHPFVDSKRVGAIGASYGGFLTMTLVTKTDLLAAAVSHAGISSLPGYWGQGYWGYSYGAVANADAFPWNRRDVFVEKSPIFHADRVKTPILLTHGTADTNVPTGESDAFFTALKLAGAPVEYVQLEGLDHVVTDHAKRVVWSRTVLAWFDRYLKGEGEWWNDLWPDRAAK